MKISKMSKKIYNKNNMVFNSKFFAHFFILKDLFCSKIDNECEFFILTNNRLKYNFFDF